MTDDDTALLLTVIWPCALIQYFRGSVHFIELKVNKDFRHIGRRYARELVRHQRLKPQVFFFNWYWLYVIYCMAIKSVYIRKKKYPRFFSIRNLCFTNRFCAKCLFLPMMFKYNKSFVVYLLKLSWKKKYLWLKIFYFFVRVLQWERNDPAISFNFFNIHALLLRTCWNFI